MATGFRSKMTWLHTWSGLILGWLLFAIFVTGTSAYYRGEITLWMKPELHKSQVSEKTFEVAIDKALESSKKFTNVNVSLPNSRTNLISIRENGAISNKNTNSLKNRKTNKNIKGHRDFDNNPQKLDKQTSLLKNKREVIRSGKEQKANGSAKAAQQRKGKKRRIPPKYYDATTGELIKETTNTAGGNFLYRFHFELYSIPREIGRWIVGIASIAMLVAIFTGIIIHKRIFKDIFTFRNKHTTRGWMDAHILPAVASIPFLIMITYSGLLLLGNTLMPWGMKMYYGNDFLTYRSDRSQIGKSSQKSEEIKNSIKANTLGKNPNKKNQEYIGKKSNTNRILNANTQKYIKKYNNKNAHRILNASMNKSINIHNKASELKENQSFLLKELSKSKLINILDDAQKIWPNNVGRFSIKKDTNKNTIVVEVSPKNPTTLFSFKGSREMALYDGISGKLLKTSIPPNGNSITANTNIALFSLHQALFADPFLRFLFFISGLIGIVLSGTGLILWVQKRKKKELTRNSFGFKLVDKLNVGTIIGIFIAIAIYFIVNRVTTTSNKEELEIGGFFIAWGLSYIYAFVRNTNKAWFEQTIIAIVLYAMLPIINAITTFDSFSQIYSRDNILIYFDVFFIFTALVFVLIAFILIRKSRKGVK
ncbi:PepSY-associated TM helix domain-containing protein [Halarcobacter sp.]|uniref:PepSY-associated TM helix domain-containing protein n=1 Tax=Halarcobacter sp. TaxID=2321133 RepID=UPI002AA8CAE5|nr:PepSY-associated TM helix domain-containing protein [Halarcobacter sp.]